MRNLNKPKNFEFSKMESNFPGYNSANDTTKIDSSIMVGGSLNVYKKINGNLANRPGKALYSPADSTSAPSTSEYVWNKISRNYIFQVANSKLQFLYNDIWYDLLTGLTTTRWVFDKWFSQSENNSYLVAVNGQGIYTWSGGIGNVSSKNTTSLVMLGDSTLTGTTTMSGTVTASKIVPYLNPYTAGNFAGTLVGNTNPSNGDTLIINANGVSGITITFVSVIGATPGNVLIGATISDTMSNLIGMLVNPGTTNTLQVALSAPNQAAIQKLGTVPGLKGSLEISGANTWAEAGFTWVPSGGFFNLNQMIVNGVTFEYWNATAATSVIATYNVSDVSTVSPGDFIYQATNTYAGIIGVSNGFLPDFCKTIDNQVYYGNYTSQNSYVSGSNDPYDATAAATPVQGSANAITFDGNLDGITVRNGKPYVGVGGSKWGIINYTYQTVGTDSVRITTVDYTPVSAGSGPYAHEFIDQVGDSIVYLSQDQQVRTFGSFNTSFTSNNYPSLSQEIYTELQAETFSDDTYTGNLRAIGDYLYLTAPTSGKTYLYQARQAVNSNNQVIVERLWHAPMSWGLTRVDVVDNTVIGFSNSNPQIYQLWDTGIFYDEDPSGSTFPYTSTLKFAYDGQRRRQGLWSFDKVYSEGYINEDTTLTLNVLYNYQGAENNVRQFVNSTTYPAIYFVGDTGVESTDIGSLGDVSLGDESLGGTGDVGDVTAVRFKTINQFSLTNCFEYQLIYQSENQGDSWELSAKAVNAEVETEQDATYIINQQ